jgi:hypothetical protein
MKNLFLTLLFVGGVAALTSCKKDYTCTCTVDGETYTYELKDVKKKDAKDACDAAGSLWILAGGTCDFK